jgi:hypothetical protein
MTYKELIENLNEWKFHYIIAQVNNLIKFENESLDDLSDINSVIKSAADHSDSYIKIVESLKVFEVNYCFQTILSLFLLLFF